MLQDLRFLSPEQCALHHGHAFPEAPWSAQTFQELFCLQTVFGECLFLDSEFQGLYCLQATEDTCDILTFFVAKPFQSQGIGEILLKQMIAKTRALQIKKIFLEVSEANLPAQKLYQKAGFLLIGVRKKYYRQKDSREQDALTFCLFI